MIFYPQEQEDELRAGFPHVVAAAQVQGLRLHPVQSVEEALTWLLFDSPLYTSPHLARSSRFADLSHLEYRLLRKFLAYMDWVEACFRRAVDLALPELSLEQNEVTQLRNLPSATVLVLHYVHTLTLAGERATAEDIVRTLHYPPAVIDSALSLLRATGVVKPGTAEEGYRTTSDGAVVIKHYRAIRDSTLIPALALQPGDEHRVAAAAHMLRVLEGGYARAAEAAREATASGMTNH